MFSSLLSSYFRRASIIALPLSPSNRQGNRLFPLLLLFREKKYAKVSSVKQIIRWRGPRLLVRTFRNDTKTFQRTKNAMD